MGLGETIKISIDKLTGGCGREKYPRKWNREEKKWCSDLGGGNEPFTLIQNTLRFDVQGGGQS